MHAISGFRPRHIVANSERIRLIVVEIGGSTLTGDGAEGFDETIAIAQGGGEDAATFAERVLQRVAAVERSGRSLDSAVLFVSGQHDPTTNAARRSLTLGIAAHARASYVQPRASELTIVATPTAAIPMSAELLCLVDELVSTPESNCLRVRLHSRERGEDPRNGAA